MPDKIKAVMQRPGEISEIVYIEDNLSVLRALMGGIPTSHRLPENGLLLLFLDRQMFLQDNIKLSDIDTVIGGTVIITNENEHGELFSLTTEQIQSARAWLLKNTYMEE